MWCNGDLLCVTTWYDGDGDLLCVTGTSRPHHTMDWNGELLWCNEDLLCVPIIPWLGTGTSSGVMGTSSASSPPAPFLSRYASCARRCIIIIFIYIFSHMIIMRYIYIYIYIYTP